MEFKTEAHKTAYEKTRNYLYTIFGEVNVKTIDDTFVLQEGTTFVYVRTFAIGDNKAGVEVFSYVAIDVEASEELMRFLLAYNLRLILGAFGLSFGEGKRCAVLLTHTILGDSMDREELRSSVTAIARVSDDLDEQIVKAFGGRTALDKLMAAKHAPAEVWE